MAVQNSKKIDNNKGYFHIYNKGVENRKLFSDQEDYRVFLGYLKDYLSAPPDPEKTKKSFSVKGRTFRGVPHQPKNYFNKVELIAFGLMPDHFHLLINQKTKGSLERLIRSLCTRYAIYYNKKYQRRGSLFVGPYKSIQINSDSQLLHLTRYLHRELLGENTGDKNLSHDIYSSYKEYLGARETLWIKPKAAVSYLDQLENGTFKGIEGYKKFVEEYELNQKDKKSLERIIIESKSLPPRRHDNLDKSSHLEKRILEPDKSKSFQASPVKPEPASAPVSKFPLNIFGFATTATAVFVLLFTLGIRNIKTSAAQNSVIVDSTTPSTPQVSGAKDTSDEKIKIEKIGEEKSESPQPQLRSEETQTPEGDSNKPETVTMVVITITDGSESVNIRQEPTTKSEKIGEVKDGETFELISKSSRWYQIKLDDESIAFVSARYAEIQEEKESD